MTKKPNVKFILKLQSPRTSGERRAAIQAMYGLPTWKDVLRFFEKRCKEAKENEESAQDILPHSQEADTGPDSKV